MVVGPCALGRWQHTIAIARLEEWKPPGTARRRTFPLRGTVDVQFVDAKHLAAPTYAI